MGMESFFIVLLPENVKMIRNNDNSIKYSGNSNIKMDDLMDHLNALKYDMIKISNDTFILNNIIKFCCDLDKGNIFISGFMEICLFHYEEGIELIFNIHRHLMKAFNVHLFFPSVGILSENDFSTFKSKLDEIYGKKKVFFTKNSVLFQKEMKESCREKIFTSIFKKNVNIFLTNKRIWNSTTNFYLMRFLMVDSFPDRGFMEFHTGPESLKME
jgi:hypothetical protein